MLDAHTSLFLIEDLTLLRAKIANLDGPLAQLWREMQRFVRNRPEQAWMMAPFVAVVTGDEEFITIARREVVTYCRRLPGRSLSIDVQGHFWCPSFQVARMGIYYSWLRELGHIPDDEAAMCEQHLLDYAFAHIYTSGLTKPSSLVRENQSLSLSFGCTVLGYLLGYRLSDSPTARLMMAEGLRHLRTRITSFHRGGWSGEGSTYQMKVVGPAVSLASMVLEAITGTDVFFWRSSPEHATPAEVAVMAHRCTMPDGLALPWDNYGFFESDITLTSAVLARKYHDASFVNWLSARRIFTPYVHVGWGRDEKVLTLLFWPDDTRQTSPRAFTSWDSAMVGAAYVSPDERVIFMQLCDEHGAGMEVRRPQCNPNHVVYGVGGSHLFVDGIGKHRDVFRFSGCRKHIPHINGLCEVDWSEGGPGAHSCVLIDGQEGYIPTVRAHGTVMAFDDLGHTALLATESAASYQPTYDVTRVQRTSALLAQGRAVVIRDRIEAATPHTYQSRFYVRPNLRAMPAQQGLPYFIVDTPERVRFHLVALEPVPVSHREIVGFPTVFEGRAAVLDFPHASPGIASTFDVLVIAEEQVEPLSDVTDGWMVYGGTTLDSQVSRDVVMPLDGYLSTLDAVLGDRVLTLRKTLALDAALAPREVCLQLPRGLRTCPVLVNGHRVVVELPEPFRPVDDIGTGTRIAPDLLQPWVTLKAAGEAIDTCEVTVVFERVTGSDHLYSDTLTDSFLCGRGPATLGATRVHALHPEVQYTDGRLTVTGLPEGELTADLQTLEDGQFRVESGASSTSLQQRYSPGLFHASRPLNVCLTDHAIHLGTLTESFTLCIDRYDAPVEIEWYGGLLDITYFGSQMLRLEFASPHLLAVIVNGDKVEGTERVMLGIPQPERGQYQQDVAMRWCHAGLGEMPTAQLLALLGNEHWQVRMAAAVACGVRREAAAREALLALLADERDEVLFENTTEYFWFVHGDADAFDGDKAPLSREHEPTRFDAWSRRWRLKGQVVRALGRIGGLGVEEAILASLSDRQDFHYFVCVGQALATCGTALALPTLQRWLAYEEYCTQSTAATAIAAIAAREAAAMQTQPVGMS